MNIDSIKNGIVIDHITAARVWKFTAFWGLKNLIAR